MPGPFSRSSCSRDILVCWRKNTEFTTMRRSHLNSKNLFWCGWSCDDNNSCLLVLSVKQQCQVVSMARCSSPPLTSHKRTIAYIILHYIRPHTLSSQEGPKSKSRAQLHRNVQVAPSYSQSKQANELARRKKSQGSFFCAFDRSTTHSLSPWL